MTLLLALLLSAASAEPVDLNSASIEQIAQLHGVGVVRAQAIVQWREEHGPFVDLEHIVRLPGIGLATVRALQDQATVHAASTPQGRPNLVDINADDAQTIAALPAIPLAVARRLVVDRQRHGAFEGCHDLIRVTGVGRATVAAVKGRCQAP